MKFTRHNTLYTFLVFASISLLFPNLKAQDAEEEMIDPYMEFSYWKNTDDQKVLRTKMSYFTDIFQLPLEGLTISYTAGEEEPFNLGSAVTNSKGIAEFIINEGTDIPLNADGQMYFSAEFEGNDRVYDIMEEVWVQNVDLEMILEQTEGKRMVHLTATTEVEGETVPVSDEDIYVYIPRMFSDLQVGEGYFVDGSAEVEFPSDIPGDSLGYLTIIARFNDHYLFGNVEKKEKTAWGIPSYHEGPGEFRALWTQMAPKWMIVTLTILLMGVWGHYIFTIVSIIRINKNGKQEIIEN